jgi:hypothetical protein
MPFFIVQVFQQTHGWFTAGGPYSSLEDAVEFDRWVEVDRTPYPNLTATRIKLITSRCL